MTCNQILWISLAVSTVLLPPRQRPFKIWLHAVKRGNDADP
jgi:hypothetical protein